MSARAKQGFTLIELMAVVAVLGLLIAILVPSLGRVRKQSKRTACMSNLRQIGTAIQAYRNQNRDHYPVARSMPEPFVTAAVNDPPLFDALQDEIPKTSRVYACPGDSGYVHARCGISYLYNTNLSGRQPEDVFLHRELKVPIHEIPAAYDFDGATVEIPGASLTIPFFHLRRNLLFADGHVGEFHVDPTSRPSL